MAIKGAEGNSQAITKGLAPSWASASQGTLGSTATSQGLSREVQPALKVPFHSPAARIFLSMYSLGLAIQQIFLWGGGGFFLGGGVAVGVFPHVCYELPQGHLPVLLQIPSQDSVLLR